VRSRAYINVFEMKKSIIDNTQKGKDDNVLSHQIGNSQMSISREVVGGMSMSGD
jgi:hypothetical protein